MRRALPLLLCMTAAACIGHIGDPPEPTSSSAEASCSETIQPGPSPIRRMTRFEYNNTVRDLLGDDTGPADDFGAEEEALGFNNNAANLVTSSTLAEKYMLAAEGIAERATETLSKNVPCDPAVIGDDECAHQFIDLFGRRAFRRPLATDEHDELFVLYQLGHIDGGFRLGVEMVIEAALQSPAFLYRVELGHVVTMGGSPGQAGLPPQESDESIVLLDDWEMASRLSYFLWGTMPDGDLFAAAEAGQLRTKEQVAAQARRMLDDPKARDAVANFHLQWLDYDRIANVGKDTSLFPEWSPALRDLMRRETEAFLDATIFDEGGDLKSLLTASFSFMSPELAAFYGVDVSTMPPDTPDGFVRVELDPTQRAGLLTMGSLLTINAHSNQTSPVHRGKLVRELFLCDQMPPPPPNIMITVPTPDPDSTARERFAEHSKNEACKGCHELMDGLGFGFENYDAVGRFRTEDNGKVIDATGELIKTDIDGEFDGVVELAHRLTTSDKVRDCYATQWFRFAYGRGETSEDTCTMESIKEQFSTSGGDIKELIVALTQTDAFLYRRAGGTQ